MMISQQLRIIQRLTGKTQERLAKTLGVSFVTLNSWINDRSKPRPAKRERIESLYKQYTGQATIPVTVLHGKKRIIQQRSKGQKHVIDVIRNHPDVYDELVLALTYNSNSIEGSTLTQKETAAILFDNVTIVNKNLIEHLEAKNHQTAFEFLVRRVKKNFRISESFLLELHRILMNGIRPDAGRYRDHGVRIVGTRVPTANHLTILRLIRRLVQDINKPERDVIKHVAIMHSQFEKIHPFSDGNGRIGRLLIQVMLLRKNIAPAMIKQEEKRLYYSYLEKSQLSNDSSLLQDFLCDAVLDGFDIVHR
jgi:Fic family protein